MRRVGLPTMRTIGTDAYTFRELSSVADYGRHQLISSAYWVGL